MAQPSRTWLQRFAPWRLRAPSPAWRQPAAAPGPGASSSPGQLVPGAATPGAVSLLIPPVVDPSDSDHGHGEDSGFAFLAGPDAAAGADSVLSVALASSDAGHGTEVEKSAWPHDAEAGHGTDGPGFWTGPINSSDTGHGTDGGEVTKVLGPDSATGTDSGPVIDVYSFQPPFRFDGGSYRLVFEVPHAQAPDVHRELQLWRGERPDGTAFRLAAAHAEGRLWFTSDADEGGGRDEQEVAMLRVTAEVVPALECSVAISAREGQS
jgi:hypothetical protein